MKNTALLDTPSAIAQTDPLSDEEALKNFLLDIECLDQLDEWIGKFNLFDILKITRTEIRHSNILAWLLTPDENHGLKDNILKGFIQFAITSLDLPDQEIFKTLLMDYRSFVLYREWHCIDIMAVSEKEKCILCIENKIDSGEHSNQLPRYQKTVTELYHDYKVIYIYLSPSGAESCSPDTWLAMSYRDVMQIIESACRKTILLPEAKMLINNYLETIRRDIVGDERLAQICAEIYTKHKKALDLIYENKPDRAADVAGYFRNWCISKTNAGEIEVVLDKCVKSYTRFKTPVMSAILPDAEEARSGWGTKNYYFCEIVNDGGTKFYLQIAVNSRHIPDDLRMICDEINVHYPSPRQKTNWEWRTHFKTSASKIDPDASEEEIHRMLDKKFKEMRAFEDALRARLGK